MIFRTKFQVREPIWKLEPLTERFRIIFSMISQSAPNLRGFHLKLADFNLISLPLSTTVDINKEILDEFFNSCLNLKHLHYIWAFVGNSKIVSNRLLDYGFMIFEIEHT